VGAAGGGCPGGACASMLPGWKVAARMLITAKRAIVFFIAFVRLHFLVEFSLACIDHGKKKSNFFHRRMRSARCLTTCRRFVPLAYCFETESDVLKSMISQS
jgi:hypothetical protein